MRRIPKLIAAVAAAAVGLSLFSAPVASRAANTDEIEITNGNISSVRDTSSRKPVIVMLTTSWCHYCRDLYPILQKLNGDDAASWQLGRLDAEAQEQAFAVFPGVNGYPTMKLLSDRNVVAIDDLGGLKPEADVRAWVNGALAKWRADHGGEGPKPTVTPTPSPSNTPTPNPTPTPTATPTSTPSPQAEEIEVTNANFRDVLAKSSQTPVVVVVGATWSGMTQRTLPKYRDRLASGKDFILARVDGDRYKDALAYFQVRGYPTIMGFSDGTELTEPGRYANGTYSQEQVNGFVDGVIAAWKSAHNR